MRDYTYINGARFSINNLFRSLRFDVDRLDLSWVDEDKPDFTRGLRVIDNEESKTETVDGEDADNLIFSLTYLFSKNESIELFRIATDEYLKIAIGTKEYLVTSQKKDSEVKLEEKEVFLH